jgi:hypothetical protein
VNQGLGVRTIVDSDPDEDLESGVPLPDLMPAEGGVWMTVDSDVDEDAESGMPRLDESPDPEIRVGNGVLTPLLELAEELGVSIAFDEDELAVGV